jgi:hypothetical protein
MTHTEQISETFESKLFESTYSILLSRPTIYKEEGMDIEKEKPFINDMIEYYTSVEEYEKCAFLVKVLEKNAC